ncbi:MAG TPA: hypothetical protein VJ083_00695, partial [Sedimentibacter sp.]|nr:hypothetical protein [Sedimentibacter sp.]
MKKLITLIAITIVSFNLYSQQWAKSYTGAEEDATSFFNTVYNTACDSQGNTYFVGTFGEGATFDGIPLLDAQLYNNAQSLVVAKLDPNGNMLWRKAIKNWSNYNVWPANNLKIVGDTSIVFLVSQMMLPLNNNSYFLYYLDTLVRVPQGENYYPDYPFSALDGYSGSMLITLDLDGNLINNHFLQIALLDSNNHKVNSSYLIDIQGTFDIDKDGYIYVYTRTLALYSNTIIDSLQIIADKEREFGPFNIPFVENLTLFKFSPNCQDLIWARSLTIDTVSYGGDIVSFMPYAKGIDIDSFGYIYITGFLEVYRDIFREGYGDSTRYTDVIVNPNNPNNKIRIAPKDSHTGFIVKYSSDGEVMWTNQMYGKSYEATDVAPFCDISNVVVSEENNAVYFLGYGAFLNPVYGGSLFFEDSIPLRKYHDSTTNELFFAKLNKETGRYISHGIAPSAYSTASGYNYFLTNPSFTIKNNQVFAQTIFGKHIKGNDTNFYRDNGNGLAFIRWKDNGYIIDVKNFPTNATGNRLGAKNTVVNDNGDMILTGMFNNSIDFGDIQLTSGSNSTAYIVKFNDPSFIVPFEGGDTLNDQEPQSLNDISIQKENEILVYPNPTKDEVYIRTKGEQINSYFLCNISGQLLL